MQEILDFIRLWAEAPAEDPPAQNPKPYLDKLKMEQVVQEGIVPAGPAVPSAHPVPRETLSQQPAQLRPSEQQTGSPSSPRLPEQVSQVPARPIAAEPVSSKPATPSPIERLSNAYAVAKPVELVSQTPANPAVPDVRVMPAANPRTGIPESGAVAQIVPLEKQSKPFATIRERDSFKAGEVRVMAPETFVSRSVTPKLLERYSQVPIPVREKEAVAIQSASPRASVTMVIPPAMPFDPKELWDYADANLDLPPVQPITKRSSDRTVDEDFPESTESLVARSFFRSEGAESSLERGAT